MWHVPNNERMDGWKLASFLRYHTESGFLSNYGGNLYNLFKVFFIAHGESAPFKVSSCYENQAVNLRPSVFRRFQQFPVKYGAGSCPADHGPSVPVVYDVGDATFNHNLYGPNARGGVFLTPVRPEVSVQDRTYFKMSPQP